MFLGFVLGAAGIVVNSVSGCIIGLVLMGLGAIYFSFRRADLD